MISTTTGLDGIDYVYFLCQEHSTGKRPGNIQLHDNTETLEEDIADCTCKYNIDLHRLNYV